MTFVVPIYNAEKYLSECLESILWQNVAKEILCINDGSTDNSLNILEKYAKKYPEIKIINKKNEGVSKARNLGINKANGRYIWFVDADDYLLVDDMAELIGIADNHRRDLVRGLLCREDENGGAGILSPASNKVFEQYVKKNKYAESISNSQFLLGSINEGFTPKITAGFYRTDFLRENHCYFPNLPINNAEDEYFEILVFSCSLDVNLFEISIPVYFYRYNQSSSSNFLIEQFKGSLAVLPLMLKHCENIEKKVMMLNKDQNYFFEKLKLLWTIRFISLRLSYVACCDIYPQLNKEDKLYIRHLITQENLFYLDEFKYMLLTSESGKRYLSLSKHVLENIGQFKNLLNE
nr:glycosyltransferase [Canicola haemoglobinophilus]